MVYISQGADGLQGSPGTEGPQGLEVSVACFFLLSGERVSKLTLSVFTSRFNFYSN